MIESLIIQSASFNEDEIEVSNILLNLKGYIEESESRSRTRASERNLGFNINSPPRNVERNSPIEEEEKDDVEIKPKFVKFKSKKTRQPFSSSAYGLGSMNHKSPTGIPHHKYQYPMGHIPQTQPMVSSTIGLGFLSCPGPVVGIPNLNIVATNSKCPFENNRDIAERKAKYTEARRKRRMKMTEMKRLSGQKDR